MNYNSSKIAWEEFDDIPGEIFRYWDNDGGVIWAKECWIHFEKAELTGCLSIIEATRSEIRLLSLAQIFIEFCQLSVLEFPDESIDHIIDALEVNPIALGVLAAEEGLEDLEEIDSEVEFHEHALRVIVNYQKSEIFNCLKSAYGGDMELFDRMCKALNDAPEEEDEADDVFQYDKWQDNSGSVGSLEYVLNNFQF